MTDKRVPYGGNDARSVLEEIVGWKIEPHALKGFCDCLRKFNAMPDPLGYQPLAYWRIVGYLSYKGILNRDGIDVERLGGFSGDRDVANMEEAYGFMQMLGADETDRLSMRRYKDGSMGY